MAGRSTLGLTFVCSKNLYGVNNLSLLLTLFDDKLKNSSGFNFGYNIINTIYRYYIILKNDLTPTFSNLINFQSSPMMIHSVLICHVPWEMPAYLTYIYIIKWNGV